MVCTKPLSPKYGQWMLKHTWAATLRWDWPSNSRAEDLKPFLPHICFCSSLISVVFFGVFTFIFEYISGRFLLTSGTRWHYPRAGWKSDPTALVWRDSDFKNNPSDSHSSPSSSVSPISAQPRLVLCFFYFFSFCLSYIMCFCCKWISVFFSVLQCVKNEWICWVSWWQTSSISNLDSIVALF